MSTFRVCQVRVGRVDAGTQIVRRDLLGGRRFVLGRRDCDGVLVEELHRALRSEARGGEGGSGGEGEGGAVAFGSELFLRRPLALYNWLKARS